MNDYQILLVKMQQDMHNNQLDYKYLNLGGNNLQNQIEINKVGCSNMWQFNVCPQFLCAPGSMLV